MRARWLRARLDRTGAAALHWIVLRALPRAIGVRFDPARPTASRRCSSWPSATRGATARALRAGHRRAALLGARAGAPDSPAARAMIGSDDLILLATGAASWPELLSSGRFELSGDPFLALRFASLFRLPVAARSRALAVT